MPTITFKVTDNEARLIRSRARQQGMTVSQYLRSRATGPTAVSRKPRRVRCPITGAMIFAAMEDRAPLTTESVRDLLSNFP